MRKLSSMLFAGVVALGCKDSSQLQTQRGVDLASSEATVVRSSSTNDDSPPPEEESGGTGTALALDEGKLGKADGQYRLSQRARMQAIEQARAAGVLGSYGSGRGGFASLSGAEHISSGLDKNIGSETYADYGKNPWTEAAKDRLSTFAADVDTASYTIARRKLEEGALPPPASVRVEELVNFFKYSFAPPSGNSPFSVIMEAAPSPLHEGHHIVRLGVATKAKTVDERKPAHLVFLVDVSGSMASEDKLPLAKQALRILTTSLSAIQIKQRTATTL